jgi:hypothetical protein
MGEKARRQRRTLYRLAVIGLLLLGTGCADTNGGNNSENDKNSGFYGGMSGGWSHP